MGYKRLTLLAFPRSGSTYFCSLLDRFSELKVYLELFHFDSKVVVEHLRGDWPRVRDLVLDPNEEDDIFFERYKSEPSAFVNQLEKLNAGNVVSFKLFPGHLDRAGIADVMKDAIPAFLYRNVLDAFVSNQKAVATGKYANFETTDLKIRFDQSEFRDFFNSVRRHFECGWLVCQANNVEPLVCRYPDALRAGYEAFLQSELKKKFGLQVTDSGPTDPWTERQDHKINVYEKVENPDEMASFIESWIGTPSELDIDTRDLDYLMAQLGGLSSALG